LLMLLYDAVELKDSMEFYVGLKDWLAGSHFDVASERVH
jgi:hypothetical protein